MRSFLLWVLFLLLIPALPAWVQFSKQPATPDSPQLLRLTPQAARTMQSSGSDILWIDARPLGSFESGHIPGALWMPPGHWPDEALRVLATGSRDRLVVVYCGGGTCHSAHETAERLARELKLTNLRILEGGYPAWKELEP